MKTTLRILPVLSYIVIVVGLFYAFFTPPAGHILFGDDYLQLTYYQRLFVRESLARGQLPLWDPYLYGGAPALEHPQLTFWYPVNILYLVFPPQTAFPVHLAIHLCVAMIAMYWLMRRWVSRLPAWLSGIAYGMSTFFWYRIPAGHTEVIASAAWAPLVFGLFYRVFAIGKRPKAADVRLILFAGMAFALQLFSGYKTMAIFTAEAVAIACVIVCIRLRTLRPIVYSAVAGLIGLLLDSVELLGNQQYVHLSLFSMNLPYAWATVGTPTINHLLEFVDPVSYLLRNPNDLYLIHERAAYVGSISLILALGAIIYGFWRRKLKNPEYLIFTVLCILGIWVGFANQMPVDIFAFFKNHLPWYQGVRIPTRHFFWFILGTAALAGLGAQVLSKKVIQIILIAVLLWQLVPLAHSQFYLTNAPGTSDDQELISYLQQNSGLTRFVGVNYDFSILRNVLPLNAPNQYHLYSLFGYNSPPLRNYIEYVLAVNGLPQSTAYQYVDSTPVYQNFSSRYTDALNVKYILETIATDSLAGDISGKFIMVKQSPNDGWRLYENRDVMPRFYMVAQAQILPDLDAVYTAISKETTDPRTTVLFAQNDIHTPLISGTCQQGDLKSVDVLEYSDTTIRLRTNNPCAAYLMSSEVYYPGWTASIDGISTPVQEGNLAFRAVFVPAGEHTIIFHYVPKIIYVGMFVTLLTGLVCGVCLWKSYRISDKRS